MGKPEGPRRDRKQLSWSYRNKKRQVRQERFDNPERNDERNNVQVQNQKARIIVRNLSFKVTEDDVRNLYEPFGEIEQIDLLKRPDGRPVGCGFVQFKKIEDASKAIFKTHKQEFLGRPINSTWAIPKAKFVRERDEKAAEKSVKQDSEQEAVNLDGTVDESAEKDGEETFEVVPKHQRKERKKMTPEERKQKKDELRKKRAKIIVRNLSFKADENTLREHFAKYGDIEEVKLLTREDGKRIGCGFIQFARVQSAAQAIHHSNMKEILDRPIVVDWAVSKSKFNKSSDAKKEAEDDVKIEDGEIDDKNEVEVYEEDGDEVKEEDEEEDGSDASVKEEDSDDEENSENDNNDDDDDDDDKKAIKNELEPEQRPKVFSHDISEGKTVFLKNVPFSVKNDELRACMEQYGSVYYALVCMDPLTEHSKGTAFVKFVNAEDAEKCLSAGTELRIHDQVLDPHRALDRKGVQDSKTLKNQKVKDSRNLYLVKEGVILAGSPAAQDVSAADMAKRLQMEQWKSQMLRNLNMFVSRVRLVVHNLPPNLDDATLRQIFMKHGGPKAFITEARIMRDLKNPEANGLGKSKEFAFVAFSTHEDALKALRSINNNPNIFSKTKRPIVAFSIENRVMVNAKQRRVQKSRDHNPLWQGKRTETSDKDSKNGPPQKRPRYHEKSEEVPEFSGVTSKPGQTKLRSKFNLKSQAQLHQQVRKNEHKQKKMDRKLKEKRVNQLLSRREIKPKHGSKKLSKEDVNFNKMVDKYKNKLSAVPQTKSKWYDS